MVRASLVVILSLTVSACVGQSKSPAPDPTNLVGDAPEQQAVICKKEKPTGSNRPVTVCRPVPGVLDREQAKRDARVLQRQSEILLDPNKKK